MAKKICWADVRKIISGHDRKALVGLVKELYLLNAENKHYLYTKFELIDPLKHYKDVIREAIWRADAVVGWTQSGPNNSGGCSMG